MNKSHIYDRCVYENQVHRRVWRSMCCLKPVSSLGSAKRSWACSIFFGQHRFSSHRIVVKIRFSPKYTCVYFPEWSGHSWSSGGILCCQPNRRENRIFGKFVTKSICELAVWTRIQNICPSQREICMVGKGITGSLKLELVSSHPCLGPSQTL